MSLALDPFNFKIRSTGSRLAGASALFVITALGAVFRFHQLDTLPLEMTSDHVEKLLDIWRLIKGERHLFFANNGGREPLEFYLVWLFIQVGFPWSFWTLKAAMAGVSTLNIPLVYLLGREVGSRRLGLFAAALLAVSAWHVQISRTGLRIAFAPLFVTLTLIFFFRALRTARRRDFLVCGVLLALGMYGYTAFRAMLIALPVLLASWVLSKPAHLRAQAGRRTLIINLLWGAGAAVTLMLPIIGYALWHPDLFWHRIESRLGGQPQVVDSIGQFLKNFGEALLMFHYSSDRHWFHNPPGYPALSTLGGILMILGIVQASARAVRKEFNSGALLFLVIVLILPSTLALAFPNEVPHLGRASGVIPIIAILMAFPLESLCRQGRKAVHAWIYGMAAAALIGASGAADWRRYFGPYRDSYNLNTHPTSLGAAVISEYLEKYGDGAQFFLVGWSHGWDYRALGILLNKPEWGGVMWGERQDGADALRHLDQHLSDQGPKLYLVGGELAKGHLDTLRWFYPKNETRIHHHENPKKSFYSFLVDAAKNRNVEASG
ncbi:MAG: hypothetical protein DCC75_04460 [Proteobacteria bacterium]|nr:MAG: hypothetical protein DCC75_04460 [Pseudomonadota bacterium]